MTYTPEVKIPRQPAPSRVVGAHRIIDGRYGGDTIWIDVQVDAAHPMERNGIRWSFACDRPTALKLRRALNTVLRETVEEE